MHLFEETGVRTRARISVTDTPARKQRDARFDQYIKSYYNTNNEAFLGQLLSEAQPYLEGFVRHLGVLNGHQHYAEEAIQETFVRVLDGLRERQFKVSPTGPSFMSWASTICRYRFLDQINGLDKASQPGHSDDPYLLLGESVAQTDSLHPDRCEIAQQAAEVLQAVTEAMLTLDASARAVIAAFYYRSMSPTEVCEHLGITSGAFYSGFQRGLRQLRTWAKQRPHLMPTAELFDVLRGVDSGSLFEEGSSFERAERVKKGKSSRANRTPESIQAEKARAKERAQQQAAERQRLAVEYDEPQYAIAA